MSDLFLVFKNLTRRTLRLLLMVFATFIAFLLYGLIGSFSSTLEASGDLAAGNRLLVVNKINFTYSLPYAYVNRVRATDHVVAATHWNWFGAYYQDPRATFSMFATDPESLLNVFPELTIIEGSQEAFVKNRQAVLIGRDTATKYGFKAGDQISIYSNIYSQSDGRTAWDFTVAAIYEGTNAQFNTQNVYFHYEYFNETVDPTLGKDRIGLMALLTEAIDYNDQVIADIDQEFANSFYETETLPEKAFLAGFLEQSGDITLIITSVVGAAFFIILIIVGNSMILAVRERSKEIAVLKTLGFPSVRIAAQVLVESMGLSFAGGVLGMAAAWMLLRVASGKIPADFPTPVMTTETIAKSILIMASLGLITGLIPAFNALRVNLITAFRKG